MQETELIDYFGDDFQMLCNANYSQDRSQPKWKVGVFNPASPRPELIWTEPRDTRLEALEAAKVIYDQMKARNPS